MRLGFHLLPVCSGMWKKFAGSREPYIESKHLHCFHARTSSAVWSVRLIKRFLFCLDESVLFGPSSKGQLALVIYEWQDAKYLGVDESDQSTPNTWSTNVSHLFMVLQNPYLEGLTSLLCKNKLSEHMSVHLTRWYVGCVRRNVWANSL